MIKVKMGFYFNLFYFVRSFSKLSHYDTISLPTDNFEFFNYLLFIL